MKHFVFCLIAKISNDNELQCDRRDMISACNRMGQIETNCSRK